MRLRSVRFVLRKIPLHFFSCQRTCSREPDHYFGAEEAFFFCNQMSLVSLCRFPIKKSLAVQARLKRGCDTKLSRGSMGISPNYAV